MTRLTAIAIILGATLLAGCSVSKEGTSLSESKWIDNNCSGNGFLVNESWCRRHPARLDGPLRRQIATA